MCNRARMYLTECKSGTRFDAMLYSQKRLLERIWGKGYTTKRFLELLNEGYPLRKKRGNKVRTVRVPGLYSVNFLRLLELIKDRNSPSRSRNNHSKDRKFQSVEQPKSSGVLGRLLELAKQNE